MKRTIYTDPNKVPPCGYWDKFPRVGKYSVDEDRVTHAEANDEYEFIVDITDLWNWDAPRYEMHGEEGLTPEVRRLIPAGAIEHHRVYAHSGWVQFERKGDAKEFVAKLEEAE
jgi:hypothetical protein